MNPNIENDREAYWLDAPKNVRAVSVAFVIVCVVLLLLDLVIDKHPHFPIENVFGFYGFFGFVSFTAIVFAGKVMRRIVRREEDYYD